jgi:hypothetical protein
MDKLITIFIAAVLFVVFYVLPPLYEDRINQFLKSNKRSKKKREGGVSPKSSSDPNNGAAHPRGAEAESGSGGSED